MMESFWSAVRIELLNRRRWKTWVELANAIFEYIEIFHNHERCHSALGVTALVGRRILFTRTRS